MLLHLLNTFSSHVEGSVLDPGLSEFGVELLDPSFQVRHSAL